MRGSLALILIGLLAISSVVEAKPKTKLVPEFGFDKVQQLTAEIADVNQSENFILIRQGKGANKKVLTAGAVIIKVTDSGTQVATLADLVKGQSAHIWAKNKLGPKKAYQGLIISQFLGAKALASLPPVLQFSQISSQGLENAAPSLAVSLSKAASKDVRLSYTVSGTATGSSTDYTLSNGDFVITAGQTAGVIPLVIADDTAQESDETVVVTLMAATNAILGTQKIHTYTIQDNDQSGVGFQSAAGSSTESSTSVNFLITLSVASTQEVKVDYVVTGTATGGTDYTLANGTAVIAVGQTTTTVTATIMNDSTVESNETVVLTLSNPRGATLGANAVYTHTIHDNDTSTIGFSTGTSTGAESATSVSIPVTISATSASETKIDYAISGGTATGGGTDYTLASGTLTIPAGQTTANIALTVVNDTIDELDETVIVTLSSPSGATLGPTSTHTYTIQDNDNPTVQFSSASGSGAENTTPVSIGVALSVAPVADVQVVYTLTGTATGGGSDYTLANGTTTIAVGQISANISLAIVDDAVVDANETVIITLSNPVNASLGSTTVYTYTINDNE